MWRVYVQNGKTWVNQQAESRTGLPGWVIWTATFLTLFILVVPVVVVAVAVMLIWGLLFLLLGIVARIGLFFSSLFGGRSNKYPTEDDDEERINVRVINR